jgi:macrolide transport system ATP-binding/permease protein
VPTLTLQGIRRGFGGTTPTDALRGIDLTIQQGEFVAIEGQSGGGKSTLLNIIGLLDEPTGGHYLIDDIDMADATPKASAQSRSDQFAFIFQSFHLLDRRPVLDSVELGLLYRGVSRLVRRDLALRALSQMGLRHKALQTASTLSGGERQRVAIARALTADAPIVVADEPTGNLDSGNSDAVVQSLRALHEGGATVVLVTHSPDVASQADRRVRLKDGVLLEAEPSRPRATPRAATSMLEATPGLRKATPPGRASILRARDLLADAGASVSSRIGRTTGLVAAVAVGVALAVATFGISDSANAQVADTFNAHTNRDVSVQWQSGALNAETPTTQDTIAPRLASLSGTDAAGVLSDYTQHTVQLTPVRQTLQATVYGITPNLPKAGRLAVRWVTGHRHQLGAGEVLVGDDLAKQLDIGPLVGGPQITIDERTSTIVGVISDSPRVPDVMGSIVAGSDTGYLGQADQVQALILTKAGAAQQIARQAPLVIDPFAPKSLTVSAPVDPSSLRAQVESAVQSTLLALTGVALLASMAGLANAMILSVIERKQEFGLRRALGARPKHIVGLVLAESTIVGAIGGVVGLTGGLMGILIVTVLRHWSPVFDLRLAPVAIAGGIVVGAAGGILASVRASRIQPNEALRL